MVVRVHGRPLTDAELRTIKRFAGDPTRSFSYDLQFEALEVAKLLVASAVPRKVLEDCLGPLPEPSPGSCLGLGSDRTGVTYTYADDCFLSIDFSADDRVVSVGVPGGPWIVSEEDEAVLDARAREVR
jgi:hypothetical protein